MPKTHKELAFLTLIKPLWMPQPHMICFYLLMIMQKNDKEMVFSHWVHVFLWKNAGNKNLKKATIKLTFGFWKGPQQLPNMNKLSASCNECNIQKKKYVREKIIVSNVCHTHPHHGGLFCATIFRLTANCIICWNAAGSPYQVYLIIGGCYSKQLVPGTW